MSTDIAKEVLTRFDQLSAELAKAAPAVYNKMVDVMHVKSVVELIQASIGGVLTLTLVVLGVSMFIKGARMNVKDSYVEPGNGLLWGGTIITSLSGFIFTIILFEGLLDRNMWIGLLNPEARLIIELIERAAS